MGTETETGNIAVKRNDSVMARTISWIILAVLILCHAEPSPADTDLLPPIGCVQLLREARIAGMGGDVDAEFEILRRAVEEFPDEIAALYELLAHPRMRSDPQSLFDATARRLASMDSPVPKEVLIYLAGHPRLPQEALVQILGALEARSADAPTDPEILRVVARLQQRLDREDDMIKTLDRLLGIEDTIELRRRLFRLYSARGQWERAADVFPRDFLADPQGRFLRTRFLDALSRTGRVEELEKMLADESMADLIRSEATRPEETATLQLGYLRVQAEATTATAMPMSANLLEHLAWNLRDARRDEAAERLFRRAASSTARTALIHLYGSEEDRRRLAAEIAERWGEVEDPDVLFNRGTALLTNGDFEGALPLLERAAPRLPDLEPAWYNLGLAAYRLKHWERAANAFAHAAELAPERMASFLYRGMALSQLEQGGELCRDLIKTFTRALELGADDASIHYHLAMCHHRLGDAETSKREYALYEAEREN